MKLIAFTAQYHCMKIHVHVPCITILVDQEIITQTRHHNDYLVEILGDHTDHNPIKKQQTSMFSQMDTLGSV